MAVVLGGLTPHAPALIPEIGRDAFRQLKQTADAMHRLARRVAAAEPDLAVIVTPHARYQAGFGVFARPVLLGDFAQYRAPQVTFEVPGDPVAARCLLTHARRMGLTTEVLDQGGDVPLDHGVAVPLYYLQQAGFRGGLLPVTIGRASRLELRRFGQAIAQALGEIGKRTVLLASGDLTHAAQPAGARRAGDGFRLDERLLKLLEGGRWDELFALDPALFTPQAPECAYHGMLVLAGAIEHSYPDLELLAYEHPTGVGYATVLAELDDPGEQDQVFNPAGWARQVADTFLQTDRLPAGPAHFPPDPRGVFVCLSRDGKRQVCVGSVLPREKTLAAEIARQTLAALRAYAQRHPISVDALNHLRFTVELLDRPERIQDLQALDPRVHGLILDDGEHQVVVLPGLGRLERPEDQLALALRKGRVQADRPYEMARFTAARHEEQAQPAW